MKKPTVVNTFESNIPNFEITMNGVSQIAHHTWFRGDNCNYNPVVENMRSETSTFEYVLQGWTPKTPLISPSTKVVAFGSCFANNITEWLAKRSFSVLTQKDGNKSSSYVVRFGEGMVNSFVILQQFEWALENKQPAADLWPSYDAKSFGYDEVARKDTYDLFMAAEVFIITLGLSEVWYDELTSGVFWRAVPQDKYDPSRHKFRVTTVDENRANLLAICALIKRHRPTAKVIFTMSPIPLVATFRPNSCITSNSVSKAILRTSIDETLRLINQPDQFFYWPSYELVLDVFSDRWKPDRRHVKSEIIDFIMALFMQVWCKDYQDSIPLAERWLIAQAASGALPRQIGAALLADDATAAATCLKELHRRVAEEDFIFIQDIELFERVLNGYALRLPESNIAAWLASQP
jgi:hypothetical protein